MAKTMICDLTGFTFDKTIYIIDKNNNTTTFKTNQQLMLKDIINFCYNEDIELIDLHGPAAYIEKLRQDIFLYSINFKNQNFKIILSGGGEVNV